MHKSQASHVTTSFCVFCASFGCFTGVSLGLGTSDKVTDQCQARGCGKRDEKMTKKRKKDSQGN